MRASNTIRIVALVGSLALVLLVATASSCRFLSLPSVSVNGDATVAIRTTKDGRGETESAEDDGALSIEEVFLFRGIYCSGDWTRWYEYAYRYTNTARTESGTSSGAEDADIHDDDGDPMKILSTVFLSVALCFGCLSTFTACVSAAFEGSCISYSGGGCANRSSQHEAQAATTGTTGTSTTKSMIWLTTSLSAAVCAICCVPVFLLFSTRSCVSPEEYTQNGTDTHSSCRMAAGSYLLLASLFLWIVLAILTQCMDPQCPAETLLPKNPHSRRNVDEEGDMENSQLFGDAQPFDQLQLVRSSDVNNRSNWPKFRRRWLPFWPPSSISCNDTFNQKPPDLKVDRTMMEDDEEEGGGLVNHQQNYQYQRQYSHMEYDGMPNESVEITAEYAATTLLLDTPTIPEHQEDESGDGEADELSAMEGRNDSERTPVTTNGTPSTATYIRLNQRKLNDDVDVVISLKPLHSSSLIDSERVTSAEDTYLSSFPDENSTLVTKALSHFNKDTVPHNVSDGIYQDLVASLEAESASSSVGVTAATANPPFDPTSIYFGRTALADSDDSDDDVYLAEENKTSSARGHGTPKRSLDADDEDLGSLEPTVFEETGEESILDQESQIASRSAAAQASPLLGPLNGKEKDPLVGNMGSRTLVRKIIQAPNDVGQTLRAKSAKPASRRRTSRIFKGYKLMDDSNMTSSYPWSPPLEILTLNIVRDSDLDMESKLPTNANDQDLLDEWNTLHRRPISPTFAQTYSDEPEPMFDDVDDEGIDYRYDDHEESKDDRGAPDDEPVDMDDSDPSPSAEGAARKRRRGRRARRNRGGRSVASSTSLLSATIEEETAEDLETASEGSGLNETREKRATGSYIAIPFARSRSAPALARFGRTNPNTGKVCEDLRMTGIHSFHTAQIFRKADDSTKSSREKQSGGGSSGSEQSTPRTGHRRLWNRPLIPPSSSSLPGTSKTHRVASISPRKIPMFREERANRAGMHVQSYVSDPSSSEDMSATSSPSLRSSLARKARLKRLQCQQHQAPSAPTRLAMPLRQRRSSLTPPRNKSDVDVLGKPGSEADASSEDKDNTSFDSGNYMIDMLDVQLAQLNRPEGSHIGPDEVSV